MGGDSARKRLIVTVFFFFVSNDSLGTKTGHKPSIPPLLTYISVSFSCKSIFFEVILKFSMILNICFSFLLQNFC